MSNLPSLRIITKNKWRPTFILITSLFFTTIGTFYTYKRAEKLATNEFITLCEEIEVKIANRLNAHALILRNGAALFMASEYVSRKEWTNYIKYSGVNKKLPGILGTGFSLIIPKEKLKQHVTEIRNQGFPDYKVYPDGEREIYSSIIYLEPFLGRNLRAFGYDMFSESVRRKAMEMSRDNDLAELSGRVELVQETDEDVQAGCLMYVPVYKKGLPANTIEQRRKAILGWVYSPYRMNDLMYGILGRRDNILNKKIHLKIYDDSVAQSSLLYDSQPDKQNKNSTMHAHCYKNTLEFNGKIWQLCFNQYVQNKLIISPIVIVVFVFGILVSFLLFVLSLSLVNTYLRAEQIKVQNSELSQLNAVKDKFFSIIAHDLKSLFITITGYSKILVEQVQEKDFEGVEQYSETIFKSSERASTLLMNLFEWSRSQTGHMKYNPVNFDLIQLINEVVLLLSTMAFSKSIKINKNKSSVVPAYGDKDMLSTVLRNLLTNAIKFSNVGGDIILNVEEKQDGITVLIKDFGVGIPANKIKELFQMDQNYSTPGTQNEKGTGLGLILCKEFIEKHNGKIWVESQEGKSTIFGFTIPSCIN